MRVSIFVINTASSSIKFSMFETAADRSLSLGAHGPVEGIETSGRLRFSIGSGRVGPKGCDRI